MNLGESEVVICGGTESMSMMGQEVFASRGNVLPNFSKGLAAEKFAEMYGVTRNDADEYAILSRQRYQTGSMAFLHFTLFYLCDFNQFKWYIINKIFNSVYKWLRAQINLYNFSFESRLFLKRDCSC